MNITHYKLISLLIVFAVVVSGCATTQQHSSISELQPTLSDLNIALMPIDVQLSILTAGGVLELQAEWTKAAEQNIHASIVNMEKTREMKFVDYQRPDEADTTAATLIELERLHGAVGQAILFNKYQVNLPTKKDVFDWTLGSTASVMRDATESDYALFIHIRDSYSSGGRIFMQLAAAMLGVGITGGQQIGFASLVDLRTGNVVWFNYLASGTGDLRTYEKAQKTVDLLLKNLPT
jgi:hypothetical protein